MCPGVSRFGHQFTTLGGLPLLPGLDEGLGSSGWFRVGLDGSRWRQTSFSNAFFWGGSVPNKGHHFWFAWDTKGEGGGLVGTHGS